MNLGDNLSLDERLSDGLRELCAEIRYGNNDNSIIINRFATEKEVGIAF